jgi:hypothetical protein
MKTTLTTYDIANALSNDEFAGFSRAGAFALAEYLEEYEESTGEELELDVIAIRCDFSEYDSFIDWAEQHFANYREEFGIEYTNPMTGETEEQSVTDCDGNFHDETIDAVIEYIEERAQLIRFDGGVIVSQF